MKKHPSLAKFHHFLTLLDTRLVLILLVMILFGITMLAGNLPPASIIAQAAATTTPAPVEVTAEPSGPQPTPIPAEYLSNNVQTNGIVLGSVVLVLIVVGVTFTVMLRGSEKTRK